MTFQTTPYTQWVFPDEAYSMHHREKSFASRPAGEPLNLYSEVGVPAQVDFNTYDKQVAMDRVQNRIRARQGMEGLLNTTPRSQRYDRPASRSAVPNGVFEGSPMTYLTSGNAFRGGVITTREGQEWLAKRLVQRRDEYNSLGSNVFPERPTPSPDVSPFTTVETLLNQLYIDFGSGTFSSKVTETLNQLLSALISIGAKIDGNQLATYSRAIASFIETTRPYIGDTFGESLGFAFEGREKRFRNLDGVNGMLKLINGAITEIARVLYEPVAVREQTMASLRSRLLTRQVQTFQPGFADEMRQAAVAEPFSPELGGPLPLGQRPTYEGLLPTREVPEEAEPGLAAGPEPAPEARRRTLFGPVFRPPPFGRR
jgi:hypothetical protein